jgi:uncharacterized protein (TIGR00730 family)
MRVCVYCASSSKIDESYFEATEELAVEMAKENIEVVYGGGAYGLMGRLADVILENGGKIKGIMPKFMNEIEWAHRKVQDFEFVDTMHERKAKFLENIDGIITLAGGTGTLEELLEAITLKKLGLFTKPIVILNTNGYYNPLKEMLERCVQENFMDVRHLDIYTFVDQPGEVLKSIRNPKPWDLDSIKFAVVRK